MLVVHSFVYNFVTDDAYISFVYSRNFAEHGELVFNLGDSVEGYTNFLWTVLLGLGMLVGIPPEWSSRSPRRALARSARCASRSCAVERALGRKSPWAGGAGAACSRCSSGFACWTSGGLETQLFTLLVRDRASTALVAAETTRPRAACAAPASRSRSPR